MSKSISQLRKELEFYRNRNAKLDERAKLKSELRHEKYKGLINFGKAIGKSTINVGKSIGSNFSGEGIYGYDIRQGHGKRSKKSKRKGSNEFGFYSEFGF